MRLKIRHATTYRYDELGSFAVQRLRLTPSSSRGQTVRSWTVTAEGIGAAASYVDGFGNRTHLVTHCKPYDTLTIAAEGEVETRDTGGVVGQTGEAANPLVFLRETPRTALSDEIAGVAEGLAPGRLIDRLHGLMETIAARVAYLTDATHAETTAAEALAAGQGVCQDHAHIFIAAARRMNVPARYVTGYLHVPGEAASPANHAWAEVHVPDLGWVGFDPSNRICPTEAYVRLACGFDSVGAAPIKGTRRGGGRERLSVEVRVEAEQQQQQ